MFNMEQFKHDVKTHQYIPEHIDITKTPCLVQFLQNPEDLIEKHWWNKDVTTYKPSGSWDYTPMDSMAETTSFDEIT